MSSILEKIGQLAIFLICAQTLIHFRPKESYEKYIKLLVSMMLLILLVEPVMSLLGQGEQDAFLGDIERYEQELREVLTLSQSKEKQIEQILQKMIQQKVTENFEEVSQEGSQKTDIVDGESEEGNREAFPKVQEVNIEIQLEHIE